MKYLTILLFIISIIFSSDASAKKQIIIKEIHYAVNNDGIVMTDSCIEIRQFIYDKNGSFISGKACRGSEITTLVSDTDTLDKPNLSTAHIINRKYDAHHRIIEFEEYFSDSLIINHVLKYDNRGNIAGHVLKTINSLEPEINFVYNYYYPQDFTYAKKHGRKFISGLKNNDDPVWLTRTISWDGKIVAYTERKIQQ